jgi:hypothetical protein
MMKSRLLLIPAGVALAAALAACGGPTEAPAQHATIPDESSVYALTGAPPSAPTAVTILGLVGLDLEGPGVMRAVPSNPVDVVFDIVGTQAKALPTKVVFASQFFGALLASTQPYDAMTAAPTCCYADTIPMNISAGTTFYVQSFNSNCSAQGVQNRRYVYAKFLIDSINYTPFNAISNPSGRTIYYHTVTDPNCGFTSLEPGIPPS